MKERFEQLTLVDITGRSEDGSAGVIEPRVRIGCRCEVCGQIFAKVHPKSEETICYRCRRENEHDNDTQR